MVKALVTGRVRVTRTLNPATCGMQCFWTDTGTYLMPAGVLEE